MNRETAPSPSTIGTLLTELREESTTLLRQEVALAKAELGEKAAAMTHSGIALATGGAVAYAGLIILLFGIGHLVQLTLISTGVDARIAQWLGFTLVGGVVALVGWRMLAAAKKALKPENLMPRETMASLRENQRWAKNKIQHAHHEQPAT
jgi:hypothetical protein